MLSNLFLTLFWHFWRFSSIFGQIFIIYFTLVSLTWSFLPRRWSFWLFLLCQDSSLYSYSSVQAVWCLILKKNDEYLLLLVPSDFSNSWKRALWYCRTVFCSYRYTTNILITEITTGYRLVTPRQVWRVQMVFVLLYF